MSASLPPGRYYVESDPENSDVLLVTAMEDGLSHKLGRASYAKSWLSKNLVWKSLEAPISLPATLRLNIDESGQPICIWVPEP